MLIALCEATLYLIHFFSCSFYHYRSEKVKELANGKENSSEVKRKRTEARRMRIEVTLTRFTTRTTVRVSSTGSHKSFYSSSTARTASTGNWPSPGASSHTRQSQGGNTGISTGEKQDIYSTSRKVAPLVVDIL